MPLFCAARHKKPAFYARTPPRPPLQTGTPRSLNDYRRRGMYKIIALFCAGKFALYGIYP